jgi:hypothetical protein
VVELEPERSRLGPHYRSLLAEPVHAAPAGAVGPRRPDGRRAERPGRPTLRSSAKAWRWSCWPQWPAGWARGGSPRDRAGWSRPRNASAPDSPGAGPSRRSPARWSSSPRAWSAASGGICRRRRRTTSASCGWTRHGGCSPRPSDPSPTSPWRPASPTRATSRACSAAVSVRLRRVPQAISPRLTSRREELAAQAAERVGPPGSFRVVPTARSDSATIATFSGQGGTRSSARAARSPPDPPP